MKTIFLFMGLIFFSTIIASAQNSPIKIQSQKQPVEGYKICCDADKYDPKCCTDSAFNIKGSKSNRPIKATSVKMQTVKPATGQQKPLGAIPDCCDTAYKPTECCPMGFKNGITPVKTNVTPTGTGNNKLKDPFNPGSPDDDTRNPFDTTKKATPVNKQRQ